MTINLVVRNVEETVLLALEERASLHDVTVEEELREILMEVLRNR
jgi:plasmid stability protein